MGDQWIPSIAQLIPRTLGTPTRRSGAAAFTTSAALSPSFCQLLCPSRQRHPPILTTVPMVSPTGKQAGQCPRRSGAAESMARCGKAMIKSGIGKDATAMFNGGVYNHSNAAHNLLSTMRVGVIRGGMEVEIWKRANNDGKGSMIVKDENGQRIVRAGEQVTKVYDPPA